jgi:AcrR family transcriptional regulator
MEAPALKRQRDPVAKRKKILEIATALFAEHGYEDTATSEIARRAGVAEGSVFRHFGNKQGLLAAVATRHGQEAAEVMFGGLRPGEPPDVAIMLGRMFDYAERSGRLTEVLAMASTPGNWSCGINATHAVIIAALTEAFRLWHAQGYIQTDRPEIAARVIFSLVSGTLHACFIEDQGRRRDAYLDEAVRCVQAALSPAGRAAATGT